MTWSLQPKLEHCSMTMTDRHVYLASDQALVVRGHHLIMHGRLFSGP
jgi:hypothetical protein